MNDEINAFERRMVDGEDERGGVNGYLSILVLLSSHPSSVICLDNPNKSSDLQRRTIIPQSNSHVHVLTQRQTSGEVDRVERGIRVLRRTGHLLVGLLVSDSGSAYREDEFGTDISVRGGCMLA